MSQLEECVVTLVCACSHHPRGAEIKGSLRGCNATCRPNTEDARERKPGRPSGSVRSCQDCDNLSTGLASGQAPPRDSMASFSAISFPLRSGRQVFLEMAWPVCLTFRRKTKKSGERERAGEENFQPMISCLPLAGIVLRQGCQGRGSCSK